MHPLRRGKTRTLDAIMKVGKGSWRALTIGTKALLLLWGLSGAILHLVTIATAYVLAEGGLLGVAAGFVALCLPLVSWVGVFVWSWVAKGTVINSYSQWVVGWLAFSALLLSLIPLGAKFEEW